METNEVIVDNEPYENFVEDNQESISSTQISLLDDIDLTEPAFIGFGLASAMCLISLGLASILKMFKSAR